MALHLPSVEKAAARGDLLHVDKLGRGGARRGVHRGVWRGAVAGMQLGLGLQRAFIRGVVMGQPLSVAGMP